MTHDADNRPRVKGGGLRASALMRVLTHIETHLNERHTLDSLARIACLSRFHFARMFRRSVGCSMKRYVTRLRIELAKSRIRESQEGLSALAISLGFCDQSHFTNVFRRETGVTPRRYARDLDRYQRAMEPAARVWFDATSLRKESP